MQDLCHSCINWLWSWTSNLVTLGQCKGAMCSTYTSSVIHPWTVEGTSPCHWWDWETCFFQNRLSENFKRKKKESNRSSWSQQDFFSTSSGPLCMPKCNKWCPWNLYWGNQFLGTQDSTKQWYTRLISYLETARQGVCLRLCFHKRVWNQISAKMSMWKGIKYFVSKDHRIMTRREAKWLSDLLLQFW